MTIYKQKAFSLTELLIVLVIVAILFAALAPIITKRRNGATIANEKVWNYVVDDDQMDSYYDPGVRAWTSTAIIGYTPDKTPESPYAKMIIKAKEKQRMIQFRYGSGDGINAGNLFIDKKRNYILSSLNDSIVEDGNSNGLTVVGTNAFQNRKSGQYSVAYGSSALRGQKPEKLTIADKVVAIGSDAGKNLNAVTDNKTGLYIGSFAGQTEDIPKYSVAIGGQAMGSTKYKPANSVYIGYATGGGSSDTDLDVEANNVIIGSTFVGSNGYSYLDRAMHNTIIGYGTFDHGHYYTRMMTAVGYGACDSMINAVGARTCIGYGSAADGGRYGTPNELSKSSDERIFLGGKPVSGFNGRSVLEVHNLSGSFTTPVTDERQSKITFPNTSVVMNSNIAVRGNFYASGPDGTLTGHKKIAIDPAWTNTFQCCGDWYISIFGWGGYKCSNKFGSPHEKGCQLDANGQSCNIANSVYPSGSNGCPNLKYQFSDIRLKENISESNIGLRELLSLRPYLYTFKSDDKKVPQVGVIAQDLQKVLPTSVFEREDGFLHIRWDEMFYAMINAIKTLDKKVEKIIADVSGMESDAKQLKADHKVLHKRIASLNARAAKLEKK